MRRVKKVSPSIKYRHLCPTFYLFFIHLFFSNLYNISQCSADPTIEPQSPFRSVDRFGNLVKYFGRKFGEDRGSVDK